MTSPELEAIEKAHAEREELQAQDETIARLTEERDLARGNYDLCKIARDDAIMQLRKCEAAEREANAERERLTRLVASYQTDLGAARTAAGEYERQRDTARKALLLLADWIAGNPNATDEIAEICEREGIPASHATAVEILGRLARAAALAVEVKS